MGDRRWSRTAKALKRIALEDHGFVIGKMLSEEAVARGFGHAHSHAFRRSLPTVATWQAERCSAYLVGRTGMQPAAAEATTVAVERTMLSRFVDEDDRADGEFRAEAAGR